MKKIWVCFYLVLSLLVGCASVSKSSKKIAVRYDGVYTIYEKDGDVRYFQFSPNGKVRVINGLDATENEALQILEKQDKYYSYFPKKNEVNYSGMSGRMHFLASLKAYPSGDLKNSIFLQMQDGKVVDRIMYRTGEEKFLFLSKEKKLLSKSFEKIDYYKYALRRNMKNKVFDKYILVKKGLYYGLLNEKGEEVLPIKYLSISWLSDGMVKVKGTNGKWGYLDENLKTVIPHKYDDVRNFIQGISAVKIDSFYYFINKKGKIISDDKFYWVGNFLSKRLIPVRSTPQRYYVMYNLDRKEINDIKFSDYYIYDDAKLMVLWFGRDKLLFDDKGKLIKKEYFNSVVPHSKDRIIVKQGKISKLMDRKGNYLLDDDFKDIKFLKTDSSSGVNFYRCKKEDECGLYSDMGEKLFSGKYSYISVRGYDHYSATMNLGKPYYKNMYFLYKGSKLLNFDFDFYEEKISDRYSIIKTQSKSKEGIYDLREEKFCIKLSFFDIGRVDEKLFIGQEAKKSKKNIYRVKNGEKVLAENYAKIVSKQDGFILDDKIIVDKNGKKLFETDKHIITDFKDGCLVVTDVNSKKKGILDLQGNILSDLIYDDIILYRYMNAFILTKKDVTVGSKVQ